MLVPVRHPAFTTMLFPFSLPKVQCPWSRLASRCMCNYLQGAVLRAHMHVVRMAQFAQSWHASYENQNGARCDPTTRICPGPPHSHPQPTPAKRCILHAHCWLAAGSPQLAFARSNSPMGHLNEPECLKPQTCSLLALFSSRSLRLMGISRQRSLAQPKIGLMRAANIRHHPASPHSHGPPAVCPRNSRWRSPGT